jgi:hypothetical protein
MISEMHTSMPLADERHRAVRDVQLLDGITNALSLQIQHSPSALLIHTLAVLAEIPHYDPHLYDLTASVALSRGHLKRPSATGLGTTSSTLLEADAADEQGITSGRSLPGSKFTAATPLSDGDVMLAVKAYSKMQHRNSPTFMSAAFGRVHQASLKR